MFSKEQAQFLADFADKGLAEQAEIADRNAQIEADTVIQAQRAERLAELEAEARALVEDGMREFETTTTSQLKS